MIKTDGSTGDEKQFRVGPVVRLRPVIDEMKVNQEDNSLFRRTRARITHLKELEQGKGQAVRNWVKLSPQAHQQRVAHEAAQAQVTGMAGLAQGTAREVGKQEPERVLAMVEAQVLKVRGPEMGQAPERVLVPVAVQVREPAQEEAGVRLPA